MRIRSAFAGIAAVGLILGLAGCSTSPSSAPGDLEHIDSFAVTYTIEPSGLVHAVEHIDYDFADVPDRHGLERFLSSRFISTADDDRVYRYTNLHVSSPSGASALFSTATQNSLDIRVGNQNATLGGKQEYVLSYDIAGALNTTKQDDGTSLDEFYWNATGNDWQIPITKTTVLVRSSSPVSVLACFQGPPGSTTPCPTQSPAGADGVRFAANSLPAGQGLTIDAGWPAGTFGDTKPIIEPHLPFDAPIAYAGSNNGPDPFWTPWNWGLGLLGLFGIPLAVVLFVFLRRRDEEFTGETPGSIPNSPTTAPTGTASVNETIVAQYSPPKGFPVGAANTILVKQRKDIDITATLVDLAARGHLRIEEIPGGSRGKARDYTLVATPERATVGDTASLLPHETLLLGHLFSGRKSVSLGSLRGTFSDDMVAIKVSLDSWIQNAGYFLDKARKTHPVLGWLVVGSVVTFIAMMFFPKSWAFIPIGVFIGSIASLRPVRQARRRSAIGHAVFIQLQGFREYISTAEADQIRFEEAGDVFSRYLPWAIVFGQTERWARVFAELAKQGKFDTTPDWYVGDLHAMTTTSLGGSLAAISSIGAAVGTFSSIASSAMAQAPASTGSSGGSGFSSSDSGGGGSSGGGGGGGGGGSW